ncbi:MAG TPA: FimV/HubP family polar landmark protein [Lysobacter sp.]
MAGTALALVLALASFSVAALGLGQIEVKSKIGQPLLAEIPIISSDPAELEQLQAGLASIETFARIGLQYPQGAIADLQFMQALDARGNPVIRITTQQPVTEPLLTFLIEVDWGQGRLVREYSALVDTPRTVSAPLQPSIDAPVMDAPGVIERPEPIATTEPPAEPLPGEAPPDDDTIAIDPEPVAVATPPRAPAPSLDADQAYEVRNGDTLSAIAARASTGVTLDQTMIALLRANPEAFIDGNINRLKAGAVLRMPANNELASLDAAQASAIVRSQAQEWRESRRVAPQPADADAVAVSTPAPTTSTSSTSARVAGARLEIVPPGASDATRAGTQSGISTGGEGQMLAQELTQTKETLAAREAETQELKSRIAELEKLQQQQQQLIAMKDTELAATQARLAQTQKEQTQAAVMPWVLGGVGVLVLALLVGWFLRRRDDAKPKFRAPSPVTAPTPSIADAFVDMSPAPARVEPRREPAPPAPAAPAWHAGNATSLEPASVDPDPVAQAGSERLELARAYLDLGDLASARQLLGEVVINGDHAARQQAARMLRELE